MVTGEADLDGVVPVATSLEYTRLIKGAQVARLAGTGHLGIVTRPERFAELVVNFAVDHGAAQAGLRGIEGKLGASS